MSLYEKIYNVMVESEALKKDTQVGDKNKKSSYTAIGEASVLNVIKPLLKKNKLIIIPVDVDITETVDEYKTSNTYNGVTTVNDKARLMTQLKTTWKIIDIETGEFEILKAPGNGCDTQDKASGKAWTYAYKVLLQKTFMLFSGEDTDSTHSDDINKTSTTKEETKVTIDQLRTVIKQLGKDEKTYIDWYNDREETKKNISDLKFMPQDSKKHLYDVLRKKVK